MKMLYRLALLLVTATAFLLAGCHRQENSAAPPEKVTLALATIPDTALALVAASRGYFAEEGLAPTIHLHKFGKPALEEVLEGKADFATVAETPVMFAILDGKKVSIISTILTSSLSHAIIARRDRGITAAKDLKGMRVGTSLGTTAEFYLHSFLVINGISPQDLTLVDLPAEQIPAALQRGDIDAASTFLPYTALIQKSLGKESVIFRDTALYRESFTVAARPDYVKEHPGTVRKILRALIRAEAFAKDNPAEAQKIVMQYTGLESDIVRTFWSETSMSLSLDQTLMLSLEDESQWAIRYGLTRARGVPNYLDFIYLDGLRSLKPEAVRILK